MDGLISAIIGVVGTLVGVVIGALLTPWTERIKNRVVRLEDGRIRVHFKALKRRKGMWIIPDYGVLNIERKFLEEAEYQKERVAFICYDTTPKDDYFVQYTAEKVVVVA